MRLSDFIETHHDEIIEEWTKFAATLLPWAEGMSEKDLRDHAAELLTAVVADMQTPQSTREQGQKSKGEGAARALASVGQRHATQRLDTGFDLDQLVSEYRALRASILHLWGKARGDRETEITRFNESIDEGLGEAAAEFSQTMNHTRELFLGALGHDLRNPLTAIMVQAQGLARSEQLDDKHARAASRIVDAANRMARMVNDLLDFTRSRLGPGIPLARRPTDLVLVCRQVVAELEAIHPDCEVRLEVDRDLRGEWDGDRLAQVISNLVANAVEHGCEDGHVTVVARADGDDVVLRVHNGGVAIPEYALKTLFEPMVRHQATPGTDKNRTGLGLGLFIAHEIVTAHGGTIGVTSTAAEGTTFTVKLPRRPTG